MLPRSLYAGATIGSRLQRRFPRAFRNADRRVLLVAGAAAGVAAIFKAPATGAVFALDVPYQGDLARRMLLPALVASATGYVAFVAVNGTNTLFQIDSAAGIAYRDLAGAAVLGVVAGGGVGGLFIPLVVGGALTGAAELVMGNSSVTLYQRGADGFSPATP